MTALTTHECGKSWKQRGNRTGHCSGCHETFEGLALFDAHRKGGVCADPREMVVHGAPLTFDGTHGDGSWSARNTFAEAMTRREAGEAANRQNEDQSEAVALLPTLPGCARGIVGRDPWRVQCDGCEAIEETSLLTLVRARFYGIRHGDERRLCEACAAEVGYEVHE